MNNERNFCQRCGKRLGKNDWDIHTCTPPAEQAQKPEGHQEPVAWIVGNDLTVRSDWVESLRWKGAWVDVGRAIPSQWIPVLYTTPPQRQPLTDEQVIRGGEAVSDALRKIGMAVSDEDLNATEIEQEIAEYVFTQMQEAKLKE